MKEKKRKEKKSLDIIDDRLLYNRIRDRQRFWTKDSGSNRAHSCGR